MDYTTSGGIKGAYPEVREWLGKALGLFQMTQHLVGNTVVKFEGEDRAKTRTYVFNPMGREKSEGGLHIFYVGAYYNDELGAHRRGLANLRSFRGHGLSRWGNAGRGGGPELARGRGAPAGGNRGLAGSPGLDNEVEA